MDAFTDDQLNEITARHAAATPGPWERYPEYGTDFYAYTRGEHLQGIGDLDFGADDASVGDRAFVEHAVADMGALLAEVRRLRAQADRAWEVVQLVRFRAIARAEDPYGDPVGQLLSAALIGVPSHEEVQAELRELEPTVQRRIYGPLADGAADA